jgi:FixJ family two-component response regulator
MVTDPTVFVVDDDPALRRSLSYLIESVGLEVESFAGGEEFLQACDPERPGVLILDLRMPGIGGLDVQRELNRRGIELPIILLTGHAEVSTAVRSLKEGAFDFIEKPFSDQVLLDSVQAAIREDRSIRSQRVRQREIAERVERLTQREREVMERVVVGEANRVIAERLGLSPKTVEVHRAHVMEKLEVHSLAELVRLAVALEPVEPAH